MKYKNEHESRQSIGASDTEKGVSRRSYLKGLGSAAALSGFTLSGTGVAGASDTHDQLGYGEGGYGECGYGGVTTGDPEPVEIAISIEDAMGSSVEDAIVTIHDESLKTVQTNAAGTVVVTLKEGTYNVEVSKNGYYTEAVMNVKTTESGQASRLIILES